MTTRPIIMSDASVRAVLAGHKTQTRRPVKPQPRQCGWCGGDREWYIDGFGSLSSDCSCGAYEEPHMNGRNWGWITPDDEEYRSLWVREAFVIETNRDIGGDYEPPFNDGRPIRWHEDQEYGRYWEQPHYRASDRMPELVSLDDKRCSWRPSIHMPRWACRLLLEVTEVRVERLRDISVEDVIAEGVRIPTTVDRRPLVEVTGKVDPLTFCARHPREWTVADYARHTFANRWDEINAARGYGWDVNPWVWVINFERVSA